jgi:hypothetical protein
MLLRVFFPLFLCALVLVIVTPARSQNEQDNQRVIDDFMRTRGSDFAPRDNPGKPKKRKPAARPKNTPTAKNPVGVNTPSASAEESNAVESPFRIGLGYTILRYKAEDELAAVAPGTIFKTGDELLVALETNADGYLYIFNSENDSSPHMLYPSVLLDSGRNNVSAHTRERYPADSTQIFRIEGKPATERLYIIFSRKPLPDVPTGEALVKLCRPNSDDCDWEPTLGQWEKINSLASGTQVVEGRNSELARVESPMRSDSLTRSIKIRPKAPTPAVVRMSASTTADILMTTIELTHN